MVEFTVPVPENRHPRCPCVLVLDASGSMHGEPIDKLNAAVATLADEMRTDWLAVKRVEIAIVSFPPVRTLQPFATVDAFVPPKLVPEGATPLGAAVTHALQLIEERKAEYRAQHLEWFRPWLFVVTDGAPTDDFRDAAIAVRRAEAENKLAFFGVGVPGADMEVLQQFSRRPPLMLIDLRFREMFQWLSRSIMAVSRSAAHTGGDPNASVSLPWVVTWGELGWADGGDSNNVLTQDLVSDSLTFGVDDLHPKRSLNAWISHPRPNVGEAFRVSINIGATKDSPIASVGFIEPGSSDQEFVELIVAIASLGCRVVPSWQKLKLPRTGETEKVDFHITARVGGDREFSVSVYLAKTMIELQSLRFKVTVAPAQVQPALS
jgi:uncharacterized protein YegL